MFLRMTTTQALAEADRRRDIAGFAARAADEVDVGVLKAQLAALQAVASTTAAAPAAGEEASASASAAASHSAAPVLSRLRDAERALRLAHSLLKANGQRRNGFIAKLSDSLAAASERASALEAEAGQAQAALQRLQELAAAAADGKTLRRPRPEATSPLASDGGAAGFVPFNVAAAMRGGGGGGGGGGTWAMPTDGSAGLEAYLGMDGHAGGGDGAGAFAWGMPGGDGASGGDGLQYWPQAAEAGAGEDAVAGARLLDTYAAEGDEVQRAAENEAAAASAGGADEEHDSRAYVPSGAPAYSEAGRGSYGVGGHADGPASGAASAHAGAAAGSVGGVAAQHADAMSAEWDAYFGADSAADGSAAAESAGAGWGAGAGAPPATKRPRREDSGGSSGRAAAGGAAGLGGGEMLSVDDLAAEEGIALPSASPVGSSAGGTSSGSKATGRAAGSAAGAEAAPLDIQSLIGPGKRWDGLRGMWVDEEEKRPAVEDAWRDH